MRRHRDGQRVRVLGLSYAMMVGVVLLDSTTPVGSAVGLLLSVPVMLLSLLDRRRDVLAGAAIAFTGYGIAAVLEAPAPIPKSVWLTNRVCAVLGILISTIAALEMQRQRRAASRALAAAVTAGDMNRLLMSLMAHDLRAPLVAASHALEYVRRGVASGARLDVALLSDTGRRLARNLRMIESVLHMARSDLGREGAEDRPGAPQPALPVAQHLAREVGLFADEAAARGHSLRLSADALGDLALPVDALVLTHTLAILLDNAIQHGVPGLITVEASRTARALVIRVSDTGPGLGAHRRNGSAPHGAGLGLELCRAMVARARGELLLERDSPHGTVFRLTLPIGRAPAAAGDRPHERPGEPVAGASSSR